MDYTVSGEFHRVRGRAAVESEVDGLGVAGGEGWVDEGRGGEGEEGEGGGEEHFGFGV